MEKVSIEDFANEDKIQFLLANMKKILNKIQSLTSFPFHMIEKSPYEILEVAISSPVIWERISFMQRKKEAIYCCLPFSLHLQY